MKEVYMVTKEHKSISINHYGRIPKDTWTNDFGG